MTTYPMTHGVDLSNLDPDTRRAVEALNARVFELLRASLQHEQRLARLEAQFIWDDAGGEEAGE